ncbi:MAG: single-stranded DNA-binding protein [Candidatus Woesearchaeota archaeon]
MNKVLLSGTVATLPIKVADKIAIVNIVAIDEFRRGNRQTDLVPIKITGNRADFIVSNADVGQQIEIEGKMSSRKKEDNFYCDVEATDIRLIHKSMKRQDEEIVE